MVISKNTDLGIVIAENSTPREHFAAEELQKYIYKIFGFEPSIDTELKTQSAFIIGGPSRNKLTAEYITEKEFNKLVPGPEGFIIKSFGEHILLAGSEGKDNEIGTVYAIYEFLERFLGCSLSAYSHPDLVAGELVPKKESIEPNNILYISKSSGHPFRAACIQYGDAPKIPRDKKLNLPFIDWLVKNRYNYIYLWTVCYEEFKEMGLVDELIRRGIKFMVGHHDSIDLFLPPYGNKYFPEKYYETHPEFYKLKADGTRYYNERPIGQNILCSRNMDMIEEISKNIIAWLKLNPHIDIIQFGPHDGIDEQCCCEMCKPYNKVENYLFFICEIAKRVKSVFPDVKLSPVIYVDVWECPKDLVLDPSIMVIEATWAGGELGIRTTGKPDGSSIIGTEFEKNLMDWKKAGACVAYYEYYMGIYGQMQRLIPMADEVQALAKRYAELGIDGASTQIECFNLWNYIFNFYCFGRTGYNHQLSMEDNLETFTRIFGEGADCIKTILREYEKCMDGQVKIDQSSQFFMENIDKPLIYRLFDEALQKASAPLFRNNIRLLRMAFRYSDLDANEYKTKEHESMNYIYFVFENPAPELKHMLKYDSLYLNNPGYGISIPFSGTKEDMENMDDCKEFITDKWYMFE